MTAPWILNCEQYGYPHPEPRFPVCQFCGSETGTFYRDFYGDIIGCDNCVKSVDAWEYEDD